MITRLARAALDEVVAHRARTAVLVVGVVVAIVTFAVMTELARAGRSQLDAAVERTQGRAGTVLVSFDGMGGTDADERLVPELATTAAAAGVVDLTRLAFYQREQFPCPPSRPGASTPVSRLVLVDGPLGALTGSGALSGREWSAFVGDVAGEPDEPCRPQRSTAVDLGSRSATRRLGLTDGDLVYPRDALDPVGPAVAVVLAGVMPGAGPSELRAVEAQLAAVTSAYANAVGWQPPSVDVRRVDTADDFRRSEEGLGILLTGVAVGALLLGGLAILDVQLMAVAERTRILGLYRAVGGRSGDLRTLILLETLLTVAIGVAVAVVACLVLSVPMRSFTLDRFGTAVDLASTRAMARSTAAAIAVGVAAGLLPARRAARLDVVEALDRE